MQHNSDNSTQGQHEIYGYLRYLFVNITELKNLVQ